MRTNAIKPITYGLFWALFTGIILPGVPAAQAQQDTRDTINSIRPTRRKPVPNTRRAPSTSARPKPATRPVRRAATVPPKPAPMRLTVSQTPAAGQFKTIGEAIRKAKPGTEIMVGSGVYRESVILDKPVHIRPLTPDHRVVIENTGAPCLSARAKEASIHDITIRLTGPPAGYASTAVDVTSGRLRMEKCEVVAGKEACVSVRGAGASRGR
jgi:hypothetical protein